MHAYQLPRAAKRGACLCVRMLAQGGLVVRLAMSGPACVHAVPRCAVLLACCAVLIACCAVLLQSSLWGVDVCMCILIPNAACSPAQSVSGRPYAIRALCRAVCCAVCCSACLQCVKPPLRCPCAVPLACNACACSKNCDWLHLHTGRAYSLWTLVPASMPCSAMLGGLALRPVVPPTSALTP